MCKFMHVNISFQKDCWFIYFLVTINFVNYYNLVFEKSKICVQLIKEAIIKEASLIYH